MGSILEIYQTDYQKQQNTRFYHERQYMLQLRCFRKLLSITYRDRTTNEEMQRSFLKHLDQLWNQHFKLHPTDTFNPDILKSRFTQQFLSTHYCFNIKSFNDSFILSTFTLNELLKVSTFGYDSLIKAEKLLCSDLLSIHGLIIDAMLQSKVQRTIHYDKVLKVLIQLLLDGGMTQIALPCDL